MLALGKHAKLAKLSTVTFLSDLRLRAQKSKKVEFKKYCYRPVSSILHTMIIIGKTMHQLKTRTLSIPWGQRSILGHFGVLKKPAAGSMSSRWHSRMSSSSSFFLSFFLLATLPRLISLTCLDRFQPNLVTRTPDPWHLCHLITVGSKVTYGSQGSKRSFH